MASINPYKQEIELGKIWKDYSIDRLAVDFVRLYANIYSDIPNRYKDIQMLRSMLAITWKHYTVQAKNNPFFIGIQGTKEYDQVLDRATKLIWPKVKTSFKG